MVDIHSDGALRIAVGRVLEYGVPTAESLRMSELNGTPIPLTFTTVNRYMKEKGLGKKVRDNARSPHRRFEAEAPGKMYQFDISGVKERFLDLKTRRIVKVSSLDVSKNHPNEKPTRVPIWRFVLIDDFSRRLFIRYVAIGKPNSSHVVDFLLQAYAELGVPEILYTDNDAVIKYKRTARTTEILNKLTLDKGGYRQLFHLPGNARATGKVERAHKTIESREKFIGMWIDSGEKVTLDLMNEQVAIHIMAALNNRVHSETDQTPMDRWASKFSVVRTLDYASLRSAFMVDEHPAVKLHGDLTIRINGQRFQLPDSDIYPFADWAVQGLKLRVVMPDDLNYFTIVGIDGNEYDIPKEVATVATAGQKSRMRAEIEGSSLKLRKDLRAEARQATKQTPNQIIPYFNEPDIAAAAEDPTVLRFPKPETVAVEPERLAAMAPGRVREELYTGRMLTFWEACDLYKQRFSSLSECKSFMDSMFTSRDETCFVPQSEIESGIDAGRQAEAAPHRILRAV